MTDIEIISEVTAKVSNPRTGDKFGYGYTDNVTGNFERVCLEWDGEKWIKKPLSECDVKPL